MQSSSGHKTSGHPQLYTDFPHSPRASASIPGVPQNDGAKVSWPKSRDDAMAEQHLCTVRSTIFRKNGAFGSFNMKATSVKDFQRFFSPKFMARPFIYASKF
jgi:hypothetical protein